MVSSSISAPLCKNLFVPFFLLHFLNFASSTIRIPWSTVKEGPTAVDLIQQGFNNGDTVAVVLGRTLLLCRGGVGSCRIGRCRRRCWWWSIRSVRLERTGVLQTTTQSINETLNDVEAFLLLGVCGWCCCRTGRFCARVQWTSHDAFQLLNQFETKFLLGDSTRLDAHGW